jgi:signal transduction histidine kinase
MKTHCVVIFRGMSCRSGGQAVKCCGPTRTPNRPALARPKTLAKANWPKVQWQTTIEWAYFLDVHDNVGGVACNRMIWRHYMATGIPERYRPVDALACAAAYVDVEGAILAANDAFHTLMSAAGDEAGDEAVTLAMLFVQRDRQAVRDLLSAPAGRVRRASRAAKLVRSLAPMLAEFVPIRRKSHAGTVWLVTLRPSQQATEPSADLASRAAVTAGIVHDLRAPVQVVLGWASLLKRKHDEPARIEHALTIIERNAELMMDLLEVLLEQTRPSWTSVPLRPQTVDLVEVVRDEVRAVQPLADEGGVRVSLEIGSPAVAVEGSELHLRRIVANLVGNALKFTPPGGHGRVQGLACGCIGRHRRSRQRPGYRPGVPAENLRSLPAGT